MNKERDEKLLKSWLKKKITITTATVVAFLIAGSIISTPIYASVLIGATENDNLTVTKTNNQGSKVDNSGITIGGAISKAGSDSVHIGDYSGSMGTRNVVIGTNASAGYDAKKPNDNPPKDDNFNQSVAIGAGRAAGEGARAYGDQSIAIGSNTIARGNSSIAIGNDDVDKTGSTNTTYTDLNGKTKTGSIANAYAELTGENLGVGQYQDTTSKEAAVAIGVKSVAGDISLALGTGARAEKVNAVAIGTGATANRDNAIAIGGGSTTDKAATQELSTTVNGLTFKWSGGDRTLAGDVVSFGKAGYERQLKHVSPGKVSEDSTDAINGSQLHGVLSHLTEDPVFMFAADDSDKSNVVGDTPAKKQEDGKIKKIVARSISDSRLNILGGAEGNNLSDKNISVRYEDEKTLKIKLAKNLTELESAEFKNTGGDKTTINGDGVTITPVANGKKPVSVTKDGLNNGGNVIANVAGNLEGAKPNSTEPTTNATVPTDVDSIKNNAATVGDVLNAGWNLQNNGKAKDFVKPYDTVNFADGNGTTAVVDTEADHSTSKIKYNVNLGNGLQKDAATNKITVKTADESLTVDADGLKAKTDNATITTGDSGLKVVTGGIEAGTTPGTVKVTNGDNDKIATVDSVVDAVNSAAFTLKASADGGTLNANSTVKAKGELIKAGNTIEMIAGKNLEVTHNKNGKITFATVENPSFETVQIGDDGPKFSATNDGNIRVSDKDDTKPVKITNVKDGEISKTSKDAINGSQFHKLANNTIKLAGKNESDEATETDAQNLNQQDGIKFTVKSSDGKLLEVTAGGDTITLTPKTATITTTNGVPTANTTNGKLVTADQIVNALTEMGWKATADKDGTGTVTGTASELIKAGDTVTFKAGDNLIIKQAGKDFTYSLAKELKDLSKVEVKDTSGNSVVTTPTGTTTTDGTNTTTVGPTGTTTKDKDGNETKVTKDGVTITPGKDDPANPGTKIPDTDKAVSLTKDGLNNGGNKITNVTSGLDKITTGPAKDLVDLSKPTGGSTPKVSDNTAATVGDLRNMGWVVSSDKTTDNLGTAYSEAVKNANEVKFVGKGAATVSGKTVDGVRTVTVDVTVPDVEKGTIEPDTGDNKGKVKSKAGDGDKFTTVDTVVNAINSAAWKATSGVEGTGTTATSGHTKSDEEIKAGDTVTFKAGDNLIIKQAGKDFTYSLAKELKDLSKVEVKDTSGNSVVTTPTGTTTTDGTNTTTVGPTGTTTKDKDGNETKVTKDGVTITPGKDDPANPGTKIPDTDKAVSLTKDGLNNGGNKITNVTSGLDKITTGPAKDLVDLSKPTGGSTPKVSDNTAATVGDLRNMGWVVSSDKTTDNLGTAYSEAVKNANEVKFVGKGAATVSGKTVDGVRTVTVDVTVPDVEKGTIEPDTGDNKGKVKSKAGDGDKFTTVDTVVNAINSAAWKATSGVEGTGTTATSGHTKSDEEIKAGDTVTFKAGDNLIIKQAGKDFTYSLAKELKDLSKVEVKDTSGNSVVTTPTGTTTTDGTNTTTVGPTGTITKDKDGNTTKVDGNGVTITPGKDDPANPGTKISDTDKAVSLTKDGLNNGGNAITNVAGNLEGAKKDTTSPKTNVAAPTNVDAIKNNAATVGDVLNAGWNLQNNGTAKDFVKPYDTVNFVDGENTKVVVETDKDGKVSTIKVNTDTKKITDNVPFEYTVKDPTDGTTKTVVKATDGKFYEPADVNPDGTVKSDKSPVLDPAANPNNKELEIKAKDKAPITNVDSGLKNYTDAPKAGLRDLSNTTATPDSNVATVGDLRNMGWVVSSDKTTDNLGTAYSEAVKNANEVKFVGTGLATVSGKTNNDIRTITVDVDYNKVTESTPFEYGIKNPTTGNVTPVVKATDGKYYDKNDLNSDGTPKTGVTPKLDPTNANDPNKDNLVIKAKGTDPQTVNNVKGSLDQTVNTGDKVQDTNGKLGTTTATTPTTEKSAPTNVDKIYNNAATVGDVLNAGWNLQNNGTAKDFVKPYDTVNFVDGENTKVVVETDKDGKVSTIKVNTDTKKITDNVPFEYTVKDPTDGTTKTVVKATDGKFYEPVDVNPDGTVKSGKSPVLDPAANPNNKELEIKAKDKAPITNVDSGLKNYTDAPKAGLRDLSNTTATPDSNVATVGDLRNMGWVVSSDKTTDNLGTAYSEAVKNANEVKFVGTGLATVSGKTNNDIRTITVDVDYNKVTESTPFEYGIKNPTTGNVTPVVKATDGKYYDKNDLNSDGTPKTGVTPKLDPTNANDPNKDNLVIKAKGTDPQTVNNVKGSLDQTVNTGDKVQDTNGKLGTTTATTPTTEKSAPTNVDKIYNNAATVGDVLNAGWNLENNGTAKDFVKPYDTVNFVDGENTKVVVETDKDGKSSTIKVDVKDNLKNITSISNEGAKDENGNSIPENKATKIALGTDANGNKTVDVGEAKITNVADGDVTDTSKDAVNGSQLKAVKDEAEKHTTLSVNGGDKDKAGNKSPAGNLVIAETTNDKGGKHYDVKLADKVTLGTDDTKAVTVDGTTGKITAGKGENGVGIDGTKAEIKAGDGANAVTINGKEGKVTVGDNITLNNADKSATIGDVKVDGKDGHITGLKNKDWTIGTTQPVSGRAATEDQLKKLEDGIVDKIDNLGWEATVGKEGTGKSEPDAKNNKETVRVDHTTNVHYQAGDNLIVKEEIIRAKDAAGKDTDKVSDAKYTYRLNDEITLHNVTVKPKDGKDGAFTVQNADGKDAVSIKRDADGAGAISVNGKDGKPAVAIGKDGVAVKGEDGKPDAVSITKDADGNGTVAVKGADGKSGVSLNGKDGSIGINGKDGSSVSMTTEKGPKGLDEENEKPRMTYEFTKTNPDGTPVLDPTTNKPVTVKENLATMNDGLHFAGDNNDKTISKKLNEKLEIVGGADRDKLTKNNIGVNANAEGKLEVQLSKELKGMTSAEFTDPNTGNIVKITGEGTTITNPKTGDTVIMNQGGITISKTDKDGKPNNVSLTREGLNNGGNNITNVKSNLPQVNDSAKKAYDVNGNPIANKNNTAAPITAADAADIMKKAGNNAATVGDVLNAGWNLQENGSDRDFVKPYDTVNFVDGTNTKVTVKTNEDGTKSDVQVNIVGLPIAFADKDGNRVVQGVKDGKIVYHKMLSDGTASKELVDPKNVQVTNVNPTDAKINTVGTPGATINNVAPAEVSPTSTQAVNGSQLYQVAQEINNVNNKVDKLGDRVNKGLAGAAAMSGIEFMEIGINQATVAAAVGGYRGTHAVAVGVQAAPTENTRVNAKMSLTPGSRTEAMYSVGAAYRFNLK